MIGDILRKEREKQKLSIRDVENETSIRTVYIDALEKGEYDKLPGEVYAKGFIKNYGNFLKLNGEELVRQFIMEISKIAEPEEKPVQETPKKSVTATKKGKKYPEKTQIDSTETSDFENESKKYFVAAAAFIAILISGIIYNFSGSDDENISVAEIENPPVAVETSVDTVETPKVETIETKDTAAETQAKTTEVESKPIETSAPVAAEPVQPAPPVTPAVQVAEIPANGVNLSATFSGDCWTRVIVDGVLAYEGMITSGETKDWQGNKNVSVLIGNAGAAQFVMNGESVGALGAEGDVVEKTFTR